MTTTLKTLVLAAAITLALAIIPTPSSAEVILNYPVAYHLVTVPYTVATPTLVTPATLIAPYYVPAPVIPTAPAVTCFWPYTCYTPY